ncbi:FAD binding domain-containing protein [Dyadobacter subterraneus]|uniref:Xanthine dehydrogenase family protein subunit M n=1 Tax=Dyadobacter subterraneus TaxID=2773304 RepID=A0ABR9WJD2_9BACT|nr:xanthine dehydrogenase family protein subunit M [Dyadobacter subterraneus]MBE9464269.1 xanthine dehydrogenase family protein subunit M [Dyadobacter subterraneus]
MNNFSYTRASNISEAIQKVSADADTKFVAGGTNLIDLWKYNLTNFNALVDINSIQDHHNIEEKADGGVRLGAFAKNAQTAYHPIIEERYPLLSRAILAGASGQIRNMATNGGNLLQRTRCYYFYDPAVPCNKREPGSGCSAIKGYNRIMAIFGTSENCIAVFPSDMCIALAALDAVVNVSGPGGERSLPFADFHRLPGDTPHLDNNLNPDEIITSIDLPEKGFSKNYSYLKLRDRNSYAFALVSVATAFELEGDKIKDARIALGGVAHKPWRVKQAEEFLQNNTASRENFVAAADIIVKDAVAYEYNSFKIELTKRAIIRNCMMALNPETQLPGAQPSA